MLLLRKMGDGDERLYYMLIQSQDSETKQKKRVVGLLTGKKRLKLTGWVRKANTRFYTAESRFPLPSSRYHG
jgi:hypothetical protein